MGKDVGIDFYLKSEADKMIADLEESHKKEVEQLLIEIVKLKKEIEVQKRLRNMALASVPNALKVMKIIQHHKYKRCLAMASKCRLRTRWFGDNAFYKKEKWALKWHRLWLKIAKQFKETK